VPILDTLSVMVQRFSEGRSPFSPDKNHIHHKLLALGFDHHEAVMVIYAVQGALFVLAYFLRYESDAVILGLVSVFFLVAICVFQIATRTSWRFRRDAMAETRMPRLLDMMQQPGVLPRWSYGVIAAAIGAYATLIVVETAELGSDFRVLIIALLAVMAGCAVFLRKAPLIFVEKAALYVTATLIVYLDAVLVPEGRLVSAVGWTAVGFAALGSALRLRLYNDRGFQVTPLDLIVLFMALVVPSLPGTLHLPNGGALAIAKLVIVFYALEMLVSRSEKRAIWLRLATATVLVALVLRPLLSH